MLNKIRKYVLKYTLSMARVLASIKITPNQLTLLALPLSILSLYFALRSNVVLFIFSVIMVGLIDVLDGALARLTNNVTRFGALLDSSIDRIVDGILILSLYFILHTSIFEVFLLIIASYLISYVRARAEGLGAKMEGIGLIERPERILLIILTSIIALYNTYYAYILFYVLLILSIVTVLQRIYYAYRVLR